MKFLELEISILIIELINCIMKKILNIDLIYEFIYGFIYESIYELYEIFVSAVQS